MKKLLFVLIVAMLTVGTATATAASIGSWWRVTNKAMNCSVAKPGPDSANGAGCVIKTGPLYGWSFIVHRGTIEIQNASERVVFKHEAKVAWGDVYRPQQRWSHMNQGVMCNKLSYTMLCYIRQGDMLGWTLLASDDEIEVSDIDSRTWYHKKVGY